jgi:CelD/BcsL family acetyltransferase involved in cellulose biosynthesis
VNEGWALLDGPPALAPLVGPFVRSGFLSTLWSHLGEPESHRRIVGGEAGAVAFHQDADRLSLLGPQHLIDYRSPVGDPHDAVLRTLEDLRPGTSISFDSLPAEALGVFTDALATIGVDCEPAEHDSAAVLTLPATYDDYMTAIGKKERHETRRKRRRLTEEIGEPRVVTYTEPGPALTRFFRLHRAAPGDKGRFMNPARRAFFTDLLSLPGWRLDTLYGDDHRIVAAVIGAIDDDGYYLYNSAYDPGLHHFSPGVVLLNILIERSIEAGLTVFDFLKGDETYKYRMGAESRPLYRLDAVR